MGKKKICRECGGVLENMEKTDVREKWYAEFFVCGKCGVEWVLRVDYVDGNLKDKWYKVNER